MSRSGCPVYFLMADDMASSVKGEEKLQEHFHTIHGDSVEVLMSALLVYFNH
jgi:hypothetical protein